MKWERKRSGSNRQPSAYRAATLPLKEKPNDYVQFINESKKNIIVCSAEIIQTRGELGKT